MRPASNAIACIPDKTQLMTAGVCTASAGNFAQVSDTGVLTNLPGPGLVLYGIGSGVYSGDS